jgi:hypothetical protein
VRLKETNEAPAGEALNGGGDGGADLRGVVSVIVHDRHAGGIADVLEAAPDASEAGDGITHGLPGQLQYAGNSNSGQGVPHLMNARPVSKEPNTRDIVAEKNLTSFLKRFAKIYVSRQRNENTGADGGASSAGIEPDSRVVGAGDDGAVGWHLRQELTESGHETGETAVIVEVVRLDIGDHGDLRVVMKESAGELVGLPRSLGRMASALVARSASHLHQGVGSRPHWRRWR